MHLETLKVFCDLAETKSFSKAAEVNGITQSAVSQQIRALELKYRVSLVERNRKACGLTPEGRTLLDAALRIVDTYQALGERLGSPSDNVAGKIRVAAEFSIGLHELPDRLDFFRRSHPDVDVAVQYFHHLQVCEAVVAGEADLGLVSYPQARPGLKFQIFEEDRLVLICHPDHRLAHRKTVPFGQLSGERFISFAPDAGSVRAVERQLRKHQFDITPTLQFDNIETVKRAVEIRRGIALVPKNTVRTEVEYGTLAAIELEGAHLVRPLAVVFKTARTPLRSPQNFIASLCSTPSPTPVSLADPCLT